jgi:leucyl/phenylalanyl-tRNA--protein transferase
MPIRRFPDPAEASPEGIVAVGGDLHPDSLKLAYSLGIFPWPHSGYPLLWFSPDPRGILEFDSVHVSKTLRCVRRRASRKGWIFTVDHAFADVIRLCAQVPRCGQFGTWITSEMHAAYLLFHRLGHAHSVEAWHDGRLVGGIYGVDAGGAFAAESMFHLESNASNLALLHLIDHLSERGLEWLDIQVLSPHLESLGAREIPRPQFLHRLASTRRRGLTLFGSSSLPRSLPTQ